MHLVQVLTDNQAVLSGLNSSKRNKKLTVLAVVAMVARFTPTLAIDWITLGTVFTAACLTAVQTMSSLRTAYKQKH